MTYSWKFTMGTKKEPVWEVFSGSRAPLNLERYRLIAYAKRAKKEGWFVRISGVNGELDAEKIYIGDDVFPPDFMKTMLEMNKHDNT
jgi:hypothetical protein